MTHLLYAEQCTIIILMDTLQWSLRLPGFARVSSQLTVMTYVELCSKCVIDNADYALVTLFLFYFVIFVAIATGPKT